MTKALTVVLVGALLLIPTPAHGLSIQECRFQTLDKGYWTAREVKRTVNCFAKKMGISVTSADYIANRESSYYYRAYNSSSCAEGVYQHICNYWGERVRHFSKALKKFQVKNPRWTNPRAQAVITFKMVQAQGGWCPAWC